MINIKHIEKFKHFYVYFAVVFLNFLILFFLINIFIFLFFADFTFKPVGSKMLYDNYSKEMIWEGYPNLKPEEVTRLLDETWSRPRIFESYTGYREIPVSGKYVNVTENGFRRVSFSDEQSLWPISKDFFNIFIFGGSTTFGYGVSDEETIPAHIQKLILKNNKKVRVYNFGRAAYFSIQERVLFEKLLLAGHKPDLAIFIDGLNDFFHYDDNPEYTDQMSLLFAKDTKVILKEALDLIPLKKLISFSWLNNKNNSSIIIEKDEKFIDFVLLRYLNNKKIIESVAKNFDINTVFVWQPVPVYSYDLSKHPFVNKNNLNNYTQIKFGYESFFDTWNKTGISNNFVWCANEGLKVSSRAYIDLVHYSNAMNLSVASCVVDFLYNKMFISNVVR